METLPRVVWRAGKNGTPDGATSEDQWWEVQVDEVDGTSLLVRCNSYEATMKDKAGHLEVTRAHPFTWVKTSEIWRAADRMPPTVGARVEVSEHTGAVRVGTVIAPTYGEDGPDQADVEWMVDTGTYPIVWWRPAEWQLTRADVRLFLNQPIWKRKRLLLDVGMDVDKDPRPRWPQCLRKVAEDGDLPSFLTALRALAK